MLQNHFDTVFDKYKNNWWQSIGFRGFTKLGVTFFYLTVKHWFYVHIQRSSEFSYRRWIQSQRAQRNSSFWDDEVGFPHHLVLYCTQCTWLSSRTQRRAHSKKPVVSPWENHIVLKSTSHFSHIQLLWWSCFCCPYSPETLPRGTFTKWM